MTHRRDVLALAALAAVVPGIVRAAGTRAPDAANTAPPVTPSRRVDAARESVRRDYCDGPFGQIHFRESGAGAPVLLCHGAGQTSHVYAPALSAFARAGFRAVALDTPGAGLSDAAPDEPSIGDLSTAIDAVLAHLGTASAVIAGNHTGGNMASVFAGRRPDATRALVISGPEAGFHYARYREALPPPATDDGAHVIDLWRRIAKYRTPTTTPDELTEKVAYELLARRTSWQLSFATGRFDAEDAYLQVRSPTLVVCGVRDSLYAYMETTRKLRPDFTYRELPGAGLDEVPIVWADTVIAFLRALDARPG